MYCTKSEKHFHLHQLYDHSIDEILGCSIAYYKVNNVKGWDIEPAPLNGKVVARFWCDNVEEIRFVGCSCETDSLNEINLGKKSCRLFNEIYNYLKGKNGYAIHISQLEIFDEPKRLWEFEKYGSYARKDIKCKNKDRHACNRAMSLDGLRYVGCEKARLTKAPKNYCYIEEKE